MFFIFGTQRNSDFLRPRKYDVFCGPQKLRFLQGSENFRTQQRAVFILFLNSKTLFPPLILSLRNFHEDLETKTFKKQGIILLIIMPNTTEKVFLGIVIVIVVVLLAFPASLKNIFTGESLTGASVSDNLRHVLQVPLFWIILFVVLCVLVYVSSRKK